VAHVGETLGHLARAMPVAVELVKRGVEVWVATSENQVAREILSEHCPEARYYPVRWEWSHNSHSLAGLKSELADRMVDSAIDVQRAILTTKPDVILGFPGLVSTLIARTLKVYHISVLHATYLAPVWCVENVSNEEKAVLAFGSRIWSFANTIAQFLCHELKLDPLTYDEYLATEPILVPQPGLDLQPGFENARSIGFITSSIGPSIDTQGISSDTCYVTFGTGNSCDISELVEAANREFSHVIVSTGLRNIVSKKSRGIVVPLVASASLAGRVGFVVSHGGLGTVGTFAAAGARQLIIPTEFDQATTAIYARRCGIAQCVGLSDWQARKDLGRLFPKLNPDVIEISLRDLKDQPLPPPVDSTGARTIADEVLAA
jgi:UDP:flavonoid glycosyltransferase YjiC (YdhE family)